MSEEKFAIDGENFETALFYLLIRIAARQRALTELMIKHISNEDDIKFTEIASHFDRTTAFHRQKVCDELFENFASLKDFFDKKE